MPYRYLFGSIWEDPIPCLITIPENQCPSHTYRAESDLKNDLEPVECSKIFQASAPATSSRPHGASAAGHG